MSFLKDRLSLVVLLMAVSAPAAHAQFAVIDIAAVTQLVTEVQNVEQALAVARNELAQAQAQFSAMTGDRGMEGLLSNINRNYLPENWQELTAALNGASSAYAAFTTDAQQALQEDAVL